MARGTPPHPDAVRVLLTDPKLSPADLDRVGDQFLAAELPSVAAMFFERTKTPDRAKLILERALADGDAFLLEWVTRVLPEAVTAEAWRKCAERAERLGKSTFARAAYVKAGDPEKAARL